MARVTLTPTALVINGSVADPAGTASVAGTGNGFTVAYTGNKSLYFRAANASGGSGTLTIFAGTQPLAISSGQGNLVVTVANSSTAWIGPVDSARFIQSDGSLTIETSVVLTTAAFTIDGKYVG